MKNLVDSCLFVVSLDLVLHYPALTIVLTVPASVFGFFGQNVHLPFSSSPIGWELTLVVTLVLVIIASLLLWESIFRRK